MPGRFVWVLVAGLLLQACQRVPPSPNPFVIPPQAFFDSIQTVVITSTSIVGEVQVADTTLTYLEILLEDKLREAGFVVIPAKQYAAIWDTISVEAGGFFDPYTGARDHEKFQAAAEQLMAVLTERFAMDALLYPEIWEVEVPFSAGDARWAGVAHYVSGARGHSGDVRAATLFLAVQDTAGNELYAHEAGIEVLEYMSRGQLIPLAPERLFSDTAVMKSAVSRALQPLIEGRARVP